MPVPYLHSRCRGFGSSFQGEEHQNQGEPNPTTMPRGCFRRVQIPGSQFGSEVMHVGGGRVQGRSTTGLAKGPCTKN